MKRPLRLVRGVGTCVLLVVCSTSAWAQSTGPALAGQPWGLTFVPDQTPAEVATNFRLALNIFAALAGYPSDSLKGFLADFVVRRPSPVKIKGDERDFTNQATSGGGGSSPFAMAFVGEVGISHADFGTATQFLGGVRFIDTHSHQMHFYFEGLAGITHFTGESDFTLKPAGGIIVPLQGKRLSVMVEVGLPFIFFSGGDHEHGFEIAGGVSLPVR